MRNFAFYIICFCLSYSSLASAAIIGVTDVINQGGASGDINRTIGTTIDEGIVYLAATLEVRNGGSLDTSSAFGGLALNNQGNQFDFGQAFNQANWSIDPGPGTPQNINGPQAIALSTPTNVVLRYNLNGAGDDGGVLNAVFFNPNLSNDEATNESDSNVFTSVSKNVGNNFNGLVFRVGQAGTTNVWDFTNLTVYSEGDTPFSSGAIVPEPSSLILASILALLAVLLSRFRSQKVRS